MNTRARACALTLFVLALSAVTGCACHTKAEKEACCDHAACPMVDASLRQAVAVLQPTQGNHASGTVLFTQDGDKVTVEANVSGLTPNSQHAFHVHEFGDARSTDATSAGSHYNPEGHPHGLPGSESRHAGDFGNLTADAGGYAHLSLTVDNLTIAGMHNPVLGRSVIIHAAADDGSQPVGNAGARIAIGVIGVAKP